MKSLCLALTTALLLPLTAQAGDQLERITANWTAWATENGVTKSTISVSKGGEIVLSDGIGTDAQTPMPFASLGKAITAACVAFAVRDGQFSYADTVGDLLKGSIPLAPANADITVAQLLTHGSGIAPDETQRAMHKWLGAPDVKHADASETALSRTAQQANRDAYHYNNENYAILGQIIAVQTGRTYESYCKETTLKRHNVTTATLKGPFGPFAAWGGWSMSADDYTRFLIGTFKGSGPLVGKPTDFPSTALNENVNYGMGTLWREFRGTQNYWHFGLLCFDAANSGGSYFAYYEGKVSVTVTHNRCINWDQMFALDGAMSGAVYNR